VTVRLPDRLFQGELVISVAERPHPYRTSRAIDEVDVLLASGMTVNLIAKNTSFPRRATMSEADVYHALVARLDLAAPRYYGVVGDVLLIERVRGEPLWQFGELKHWRAAAKRLAEVHERTQGLESVAMRRWTDDLTPPAGYESVWEEAVAVLEALPAGLVHGDCYPSNVLVRDEGGVVFVDWEEAMIGPGVLDLAALIAGWDERAAASISKAYVRAAKSTPSKFGRALAAARLVVAARWLGASETWQPPLEHAHDWRAELSLAAGALA
jgi:tRNA A-37 threonylcarbamoyl transferase component Bud32